MKNIFVFGLLAFICAANPEEETTTTTQEPGATATEAECDETSEYNWGVIYVGQSTKFKLYDACDGTFIMVTVSGITELKDGDKTNNKVTTLASSKGWSGSAGEVLADCDGENNECLYNKIEVPELKKTSASFVLETRLAIDPLNVTIPGPNNTNETVTVAVGSLKVDLGLNGWEYLEDTNNVEICINVKTNKIGSVDESDDGREFRLSTAKIENVLTASCSAGNGSTIDVAVNIDGNGNNQLDICYVFDSCPDGDISYDPTLTLLTDGAASLSVTLVLAAVVAAVFSF